VAWLAKELKLPADRIDQTFARIGMDSAMSVTAGQAPHDRAGAAGGRSSCDNQALQSCPRDRSEIDPAQT
jgi:hypothetical protein